MFLLSSDARQHPDFTKAKHLRPSGPARYSSSFCLSCVLHNPPVWAAEVLAAFALHTNC